MPIAVKDLYAVAGVPNMGGSAAFKENVPEEDCTVVKRLRAHGAIVLGKLNTTEGAMGGYNPLLDHPLPINPWDATSWAGASSSGSGVATSAGLAYATLGSDTGGSIRFPAAACGTCGVKPTKGLCSRHGVLDLAQTLDHVGPLTRCSADAAIVLQAIGGDQDAEDPTSLHVPPPAAWSSSSSSGWQLLLGDGGPSAAVTKRLGRPIRIGVCTSYNTTNVEAEVAAAVSTAASTLATATGGNLIEVDIGWTEEELASYLNCWSSICAPEAVHAHRAAGAWPARRDQYGNGFRCWLELGLYSYGLCSYGLYRYGHWFRCWLELGERVTSQLVAAARIAYDRCTGRINSVFKSAAAVDVLVCPAMPSPPDTAWNGGPDLRAQRPELLLSDSRALTEGADGPYSQGAHGRFTIPFDFSGHPTITLPCGFTDGSRKSGKQVPLAFQIVADRLGEMMLCELGHAFEEATVSGFKKPLVPPLEEEPASLS